ncbi:hypothetical protein BBP40_004160 [Aspergillus hancockii]|nr:hypothetical protein BBP40_004160 [Aspergillus hancockii]
MSLRSSTSKLILGGDVVTIAVGNPSVSFNVHVRLSRECSPYFDGLLEDPPVNTAEELVQLPQADPDIFATFVFWAYRETAPPLPRSIHLFKYVLWRENSKCRSYRTKL